MIDSFKVVKGEADNAIDIMRTVALDCRLNGRSVWNDDELTREKLMKNVCEENFCIGKVAEDDACCMILQWYDPVFWPKSKINEAGYIHKLCVKREYSGIGLSKKMVEFAIEECKKTNIECLRLDTSWHKEKLCSLYKSLGFKLVDKFLLGDREYALFEMKI